jgi:hypothetical protein
MNLVLFTTASTWSIVLPASNAPLGEMLRPSSSPTAPEWRASTVAIDAAVSRIDGVLMLPAWPRYALTPVFSSAYAVSRNFARLRVVPWKSNFGDAGAALPSALRRAATWVASSFATLRAKRRTSPCRRREATASL